MKEYIIFRCDHDNSTVVSVREPKFGPDVFLGVAECPDMHTACVVMAALRAREDNANEVDADVAGLGPGVMHAI